MNKQAFLKALEKELSGLPKQELTERLAFYGELIDDHMEEGLSEEEAVAAVGSVQEIADRIAADTPFPRRQKRRLTTGEILLLVLGSPLWLALLITAGALLFSLHVVLWAVVVSLWSAVVALAAGAVGGVTVGISLACGGEWWAAIATVGAGLVCGGLSVLLRFGCRAATKGTLWLTKSFLQWTKSCFRKEEA